MRTKEYVSHTPLVSDGRVSVADWGGKVYAINRETGETLWQTTVQEVLMQWLGMGSLVRERWARACWAYSLGPFRRKQAQSCLAETWCWITIARRSGATAATADQLRRYH